MSSEHPMHRRPSIGVPIYQCLDTRDPKPSTGVQHASGCSVRWGPPAQQRNAICSGGRPGDPLLTLLRGVREEREVVVAVLLVVPAAGAGAAQGGQEQKADPQRCALHLQQVCGCRCGTAAAAPLRAVPACRAART